MKAPSVPGVIVPATTSLAPIHSTPSMAPKTNRMTLSVSQARERIWRTAALKAPSTRWAKPLRSSSSCTKACTVRMA